MDRFEGTFEQLIGLLPSLDEAFAVYCDPTKSLGQAVCIAFDPDEQDLGADDFTPIEIESRGFSELLSVADINDVISNANEQKSDLRYSDIEKAIEYYVKNDAFIEL
jgi:hypothetical protein